MKESKPIDPTSPHLVAMRLAAIRDALEMNKADFADAIGIDRSSYTKMEKATKPILPKDAYRIFELWGVDLNFVYLGQIGGLPGKLSSKITTHLRGGKE